LHFHIKLVDSFSFSVEKNFEITHIINLIFKSVRECFAFLLWAGADTLFGKLWFELGLVGLDNVCDC
jgi:hypothetical protein